MTKTNKKKKELMTISLAEFENYHKEVMEAFDTVLNAVHSRFGEKFSTDEIAAFRQKTRRLNSTLKSQHSLVDRFSRTKPFAEEPMDPLKSEGAKLMPLLSSSETDSK